ncbi:Uncharacterised protein [Legionella maceachernii]|nr:hypothetical protein SAMN02745128_00419 [Legionella maceachernii]SUP00514.1 Uncharacterised protein [Legionella maceachernii]
MTGKLPRGIAAGPNQDACSPSTMSRGLSGGHRIIASDKPRAENKGSYVLGL